MCVVHFTNVQCGVITFIHALCHSLSHNTQECSSTIFRPWCEMVIIKFLYDKRPRLFVRERHIQFERITDLF